MARGKPPEANPYRLDEPVLNPVRMASNPSLRAEPVDKVIVEGEKRALDFFEDEGL